MPKTSNTVAGGRSPRGKGGTRRGKSSPVSAMGRFLLGTLFGIFLSFACVLLYFYSGHVPVAVSDKPALWEHLAESTAVHRRIATEVKLPPFAADEEGFESAARIYRVQCAMCHGSPGHDAAMGHQMLPHAAQFFVKSRRDAEAKPAGELFWPIAFGVRRSGMPAYNHTLSNTQLWQLALLLHSAGGELPDPVTRILVEQPTAAQTTHVVVPLPTNAAGASPALRPGHLAPMERPESRF